MVTTKVNNLVPGLACLHSDFLWIDSNSELQEETHWYVKANSLHFYQQEPILHGGRPALWRQKQDDRKFEANLIYISIYVSITPSQVLPKISKREPHSGSLASSQFLTHILLISAHLNNEKWCVVPRTPACNLSHLQYSHLLPFQTHLLFRPKGLPFLTDS